MEQLKPIPSDRAWRRTLAVFAGALILFYMVCPVAPQRWADLYNSYGRTAIIAMAAIYFFRARLSGVIEVRLVVWYTIWLFVTRLLNTDLYLQNEYELLVSRVLCCVVLPVGLLLEEKEPYTVAAAVNGPEAPFEWSAPGTIAIDARGRTTFTAHPDGRHRYLRRAGSAGDGARHIEALLERAINDQP